MLLYQTTKLSNSAPQKPWRYKHLWAPRPDPNCLYENKVFQTFLTQWSSDLTLKILKVNSIVEI